MAEAFGDPAVINGYHAHVYYALETKDVAAQVREGIAAAFPAAILGRWHDEAVGPHTGEAAVNAGGDGLGRPVATGEAIPGVAALGGQHELGAPVGYGPPY